MPDRHSNSPENNSGHPAFLGEHDISPSIQLPDQMVGIYTFPQDETTPDSDRTYTRQGVLTSDGWVPPASKILVHSVATRGNGPNDMDAVGAYAAGKNTRVAIDPRELQSKLSSHGNVVPVDIPSTVHSPYEDSIEFYIPDELDEDSIAEYIQGCVRPATQHYLDNHNLEQPSKEELADTIVELYGVEKGAALKAVSLVANS